MAGVLSGVGSAFGVGGVGFTGDDFKGSTQGVSGMGWLSPGQANLSVGGGYGLDTSKGQTLSFIGDPMDLFGNRAKYTSETIAALQEQAAREGVAAQKRNIDLVTGLYNPYIQAGQSSLADLIAASTGGDFSFTPSQEYQTGIEEGGRALRRSQAARGMLDSSATEARLADLINAASGQEVTNQLANRLRLVQTAQDASAKIGGAESNQAGAAASIYNTLANQNMANAANLGQARQSAYTSAAGGLSGLAALLAK